MIIDTLRCKRITREMTDLMNAYNIQILDVEPYAEMDESLYCSVSYGANRIFEANQFKDLVSVLDEVINDKNQSQHVALNDSIYGTNKVVK